MLRWTPQVSIDQDCRCSSLRERERQISAHQGLSFEWKCRGNKDRSRGLVHVSERYVRAQRAEGFRFHRTGGVPYKEFSGTALHTGDAVYFTQRRKAKT